MQRLRRILSHGKLSCIFEYLDHLEIEMHDKHMIFVIYNLVNGSIFMYTYILKTRLYISYGLEHWITFFDKFFSLIKLLYFTSLLIIPNLKMIRNCKIFHQLRDVSLNLLQLILRFGILDLDHWSSWVYKTTK